MIIVGSITANSNTIAGQFVYPKASLGSQSGLMQVYARADRARDVL